MPHVGFSPSAHRNGQSCGQFIFVRVILYLFPVFFSVPSCAIFSNAASTASSRSYNAPSLIMSLTLATTASTSQSGGGQRRSKRVRRVGFFPSVVMFFIFPSG